MLLVGCDGLPLSDEALRTSHGDAAATVQLQAASGTVSQCVPVVILTSRGAAARHPGMPKEMLGHSIKPMSCTMVASSQGLFLIRMMGHGLCGLCVAVRHVNTGTAGGHSWSSQVVQEAEMLLWEAETRLQHYDYPST